MRSAILMLASLVAACAAVPPQPDIPVRGETPGYSCRNQDLGRFTGREATAEAGAEMLRASGAGTIRWVQPGMMVTMDYREDRLTVRLDERNRILSANCG
ncbi:MAG TPA: I78 family peptidase inhibitor [Sphingomicrobium sp.]|nr:I78 family peptidase inhibitor [Sphingomicrobium sp.]